MPLRFLLPALNYRRRVALLTYLRTRWDHLLAARAAYAAKENTEDLEAPGNQLQIVVVTDAAPTGDDATIRVALQLAWPPEPGGDGRELTPVVTVIANVLPFLSLPLVPATDGSDKEKGEGKKGKGKGMKGKNNGTSMIPPSFRSPPLSRMSAKRCSPCCP